MKVLLAYDGSAAADKAFDWYLKNIHKECIELIVYCHVDKPNIPGALFGGVPDAMHEEVQAMIREHKKKCDDMTKTMEEMCANHGGGMKVVVNTKDEGAGHAIVRMAEELEANLIVTGTRGQGKFRRTILGSVSDYVIHHAKIPVTVVH